MIRLSREVRFSLADPTVQNSVSNSWGGWPSLNEIAPWIVFRCTLEGEIDTTSGYLCNIKLIDDAIRTHVVTSARQLATGTWEQLLSASFSLIKDSFPENCRLQSLTLCASPTLEFAMNNATKKLQSNRIQVTQQFEFSASHRLHNPALSAEENVALFGKCNNPHGHGHNYVVEVTVGGLPDEHGTVVPLIDFELLVKTSVIDYLDHKNLNVEVEEFTKHNPSVENIAVVVWDILQSDISSLGSGQCELENVRVYETPKTWADYSPNQD